MILDISKFRQFPLFISIFPSIYRDFHSDEISIHDDHLEIHGDFPYFPINPRSVMEGPTPRRCTRVVATPKMLQPTVNQSCVSAQKDKKAGKPQPCPELKDRMED